MRALAPGGVLSVTLWNKEEPPKSVLKLYATMAAAAREVDPAGNGEFVFRLLLVPLDGDGALQERRLHARGDRKLRAHTHEMSFDEIYSPGLFYDTSQTDSTLDGYVQQISPARPAGRRAAATRRATPSAGEPPPRLTTPPTRPPSAARPDNGVLPATVMGRLAWHSLIDSQWPEIASAMSSTPAR